MKIAVIHYHLKPGGVTTVIKQHIQALGRADVKKPALEFLVLTGQAPDDDFPADLVVIPELGYDTSDRVACLNAAATAHHILDAIHAKWDEGCDLIHIHNPLLAKNRQFLKIIAALEENGARLLLQVHDFAEDGRPRHYFADTPYPETCHWGVINSRDRSILISAGAGPEAVHLIRNAVTPFEVREQPTPAANLALYPVRAIRRKNIGEAILLSLLCKNTDTLAITLPPNSPADMPGYQGWKTFVESNQLPVMFEASSQRDFSTLVAEAAFMISTSITEGFGFSFLEPWTAGKALIGRKLPELCSDFEKTGLDLKHLYTNLAVPAAWLPTGSLKDKITQAVVDAGRAFKMAPTENFIGRFTTMADRDTIDFGMLDEPLQQHVIRRLIAGKDDRRRLATDNFGLTLPDAAINSALIADNNAVVRQAFSTAAMATRLSALYKIVRDRPVRHRLDKQQILYRFFHPDNFSLLQWGRS